MLAILFHGIDIFYDKKSKEILDKLTSIYDAKPFIVGTMGITSLFDSGICGVELIFKRPSKALSELNGIDSVLIVLKARSVETARTFLGAIGERTEFSKEIIGIDINTNSLFEVKPGVSTVKDYLLSVGFREVSTGKGLDIRKEGDYFVRSVRGCNCSELLLLDGLVVGKIFDRDVKIYVKDGKICEIKGVEIKQHGLEKIRDVDIFRLKIDSTEGFETKTPNVIRKIKGEDILFINHDAYSIYQNLSNLSGAVTIGDDTTRVSGYILQRFGLPVIGIVDGDKDGVIKGEYFYKDSVVFEVAADDFAGEKIQSRFFKGKTVKKLDFSKLKNDIEDFLGKEIIKKTEY